MKKKTSSYYSEEFKLRVVQDVLEGKYTKEEARRIHGIKSNCAVLYWIRMFSGQTNYRESVNTDLDHQAFMNKKKEVEKDKRIKELELALHQEKLRADLWQKMVDVAESQLKIDIRKKYGAK